MDPAVLAGDPDSARQLEHGDDELPVLGHDPDERSAADAPDEAGPAEAGESH